MFKLKKQKVINESYLTNDIARPIKVSEENRHFVDDWCRRRYLRMAKKMAKIGDVADDRGYTAEDLLNRCILNVYSREKVFESQDDADSFIEAYINLTKRKIDERKRWIHKANTINRVATIAIEEN